MAYGSATHLWIHGTPEAAVLKDWILAAKPDATDADLSAFRLGSRTLLVAVNVNDGELRWRSIRLIGSTSSHIRGFDWTLIDMHPDASFCQLEGPSFEPIHWDERSNPSPAVLDAARARIRALVPLELLEVHHYVDWAHKLETIDDGARAPDLTGTVQFIALNLPANAYRPTPSERPPSLIDRALPFLILAFCIVATLFTVSVTQAPGPNAFISRALHVEIQATLFWLFALFVGDVRHRDWSRAQLILIGLAAISASAVLWGVVPS